MAAVDTDLNYTSYLYNLFLAAKNEKRGHRESWLRNYRALQNRVGTPQTTQWQPTPRTSEVYPIVANRIAWMTDHNIVIDVVPAADPSSDFASGIAKICNDLSAVLYATWQTQDFMAPIKLSLWDDSLCGTGIYKVGWDATLDAGYGNVTLDRIDPFFFYPDPNATSLEDANYLIEAHMMSLAEIERRWPEHALALEAAAAGEDTGLDSRPTITSQDGSHIPVQPGSQIGSNRWQMGGEQHSPGWDPNRRFPVYEYWLRENEPYYDGDTKHIESQWKVVVVCRNIILMEEQAKDLFPFPEHPYVDYRSENIGEFWGIALVDHLTQPQLYINRILTALQYNVELTGNPIFMEPANSGINRTTIPARPGNRLTVNPGAMQSGSGPSWLPPPQMSPQAMEMVQFWISRMENLSGMSGVTKGQTPPTQRSAQGTINTIQEAAFVRIRAAQANLERSLEKCARKLSDLIISNYTEPRIMSVIGSQAKQSALALNARHFLVPTPEGAEPLKYSLLVQAGASAPTSRSSRIAEADKLYAMGAIDDQALLEAHQYPNKDDIIARKAKKMAAGIHQPPGARQKAARTT